jgi:8-oxo-dGTP pyrophosphatase MutT (NUDIX family)
MAQMYKIFVNNKKVFLAANPAKIEEALTEKDVLFINYKIDSDIQAIIENFIFNAENNHTIIIFCKDIARLKADFFDYFTVIEAAGGIVFNPNGAILLIHRRGSWDLPKGKIDAGETIEAAAIREVGEETGIRDITISSPVSLKYDNSNITYHYYETDRQKCLKLTHWFIMQIEDEQPLIPQTEEDIEKAVWVKRREIKSYFDNMYGSIKDVIESVLQ